jgi:hypothetical protein
MITFINVTLFAQNDKLYSMRGVVTDAITQQPLIGALCYMEKSEHLSSITDENGEFRIEGLEIGRQMLKVTYLGYENFSAMLEITSGKELVVNVGMREDIKALDEVVITADGEKNKPVNTMSYASTRTFSVEESNKFAGAVDDPARMVQSFAGVVATDDGSNYVSIRGNHPSGLLYRMEGIDIPNPNHFGDVASSGGGVSVLSSQVLANSDFSTGAFSAEYGNAIGGVFDIKLRKGNNQKNEFTLKAGFLGMEAAIEGPFSKKYKGSYLVNYRYSTLSIIDKLGVDLNGVLNYSDLSYNIHLPLGKRNTLSFFGISGWSNQKVDESLEDLDTDQGALAHKSDGKFLSNLTTNGVKYNTTIHKNGFLSAIVAYSRTLGGYRESVNTEYPDYSYFNKINFENSNDKLSSALTYTQKINRKMTLRSGVYYDYLSFEALYNKYTTESDFINLVNRTDNSALARAYSQLQYRINERWTTNIGLHYANFMLNNKQVIEPRGNIQYSLNPSSSISLAYGRHSQIQPLMVYFVKSNEGEFMNEDLDFTKANHLVLTYQLDITKHTRIKSEIYYQSLSDIPVGMGENRNYAMVNQQFFFPDFALTSEGKGRNLGLEITLERFLHKNWYYILTGSIFDSKYKTPTSAWTNTRYNAGHSAISTIGKEWVVGRKKRNTFGINIKNAWVGGQWDTPIDREASRLQQKEVRDESKPFSVKFDDFYKLDVGVKYKRNKTNFTSTLSLDLMNATNSKNTGGVTYDVHNDKITEWNMMPFVPVLSYKVEF